MTTSHKDEPTVSFESETFPGVRITIQKLDEVRLRALLPTIAESIGRIRRYGHVPSPIETLKNDLPFIIQHPQALLEIAARIDTILVEYGAKSISGLEIDGEPATVETLLEDGPASLVTEIAAAIREAMGLPEPDPSTLQDLFKWRRSPEVH
jgi:hypothetical protein